MQNSYSETKIVEVEYDQQSHSSDSMEIESLNS